MVLALGAGFYIYKDLNKKPKKPEQEKQIKQVEQKSSDNICSASATSSDCLKNVKIPGLDKPILIPADWPADVKKLMKSKIESLVSDLKKDPDSFDNWIGLGVQRKAINDYEGAGECWEYAGVIRPLNYVSFNNLGELYGYYLKDYKKADDNFLTAAKNGPDQIYIYRNMYEFYRNILKDDVKAKAILQKGIAANPNTSKDLKYLLDNF